MRKSIFLIGVLAGTAAILGAQTIQRKAVFVNGGSPNQGRCTVQVVVDGSAEIQIRGDTATLRNTSGQAPQWRRFECSGPMPANPQDFRFSGLEGRGQQMLIRDPRNGNGTAVVQIADPEAGAGDYTFEVSWGNGGGPITQGPQDRYQQGPQDRYPQDRNRQDRSFEGPDQRPPDQRQLYRDEPRFTADRTVQICQDSIRDRAISRFRTQNIDFQSIHVDDNPGRQDWVSGELAIPRRFGRPDIYRFSCSVDFRTGQVRSAQIDQFERGYYPQPGR